MNNLKEEKLGISWVCVLLGALMLLISGIMIVQGINAQKTGAIIPATTKSGPMTGLQSIITGIIAGVAGAAFLGYEVYKMIMRKRENASNKAARPDR